MTEQDQGQPEEIPDVAVQAGLATASAAVPDSGPDPEDEG
jgi:hypothetical protein